MRNLKEYHIHLVTSVLGAVFRFYHFPSLCRCKAELLLGRTCISDRLDLLESMSILGTPTPVLFRSVFCMPE